MQIFLAVEVQEELWKEMARQNEYHGKPFPVSPSRVQIEWPFGYLSNAYGAEVVLVSREIENRIATGVVDAMIAKIREAYATMPVRVTVETKEPDAPITGKLVLE